jgi:trehalose synthase
MSYLLGRYEQLLGGGPFRTLEGLARRLRGRRLVMVNTTRTGGGVAEILRQVVPLLNELGIPTDWEIMEGDEAFFRVTKRIHSARSIASGITSGPAARRRACRSTAT